MGKNSEKKIIFSEEIDSTISGFSLVITFIGVGIFLIFNKDYFGNQIVANIIQWIFIVIGCLGFWTEVSKINKKRRISGTDNLSMGIVMIIIWAVVYYIFKHWIGNVIGFFILVIGLYGVARGIIEIGYSITKLRKNSKKEEKHDMSVVKDVVLIFSEIAGMVLIIIQILQAIKIV